jgi:hypothetical protein
MNEVKFVKRGREERGDENEIKKLDGKNPLNYPPNAMCV